MNNENLDRLFRDKLAHREIPFSAAAWQDMEKTLDASGQKGAGWSGLTLFGIFAGLFAAGITVFWLWPDAGTQARYQVAEVIPFEGEAEEYSTTQLPTAQPASPVASAEALVTAASNEPQASTALAVQTVETEENQLEKELERALALKQADMEKIRETRNKRQSTNSTPALIASLEDQPQVNQRSTGRSIKFISLMEYMTLEQMPRSGFDQLDSRSSDDDDYYGKASRDFGLLFGTQLSRGFVNTEESRGLWSLSPVIGLRYSRSLNPYVSLNVNLLYQNMGGLNSRKSVFVSDGITAPFIEDERIDVKRLHFIDIPVYLEYTSGLHAFMGGFQVSQLLTTYGKVEKRQNDGSFTESGKWGMRDGFSNYDVSALLGYSYQWNERLRIGLRGNYGWGDMTRNSYFDNDTKDTNLQFRLLFDYQLFRK